VSRSDFATMAVPIIKTADMQRSLAFYTNILGFQLTEPLKSPLVPVVELVRGKVRIQISSMSGDSVFGIALYILVENVDGLFQELRQRGLDTSAKAGSPVHQAPLEQTWGAREFYVDDPDGNTIRFRQAKVKRKAR